MSFSPPNFRSVSNILDNQYFIDSSTQLKKKSSQKLHYPFSPSEAAVEVRKIIQSRNSFLPKGHILLAQKSARRYHLIVVTKGIATPREFDSLPKESQVTYDRFSSGRFISSEEKNPVWWKVVLSDRHSFLGSPPLPKGTPLSVLASYDHGVVRWFATLPVGYTIGKINFPNGAVLEFSKGKLRTARLKGDKMDTLLHFEKDQLKRVELVPPESTLLPKVRRTFTDNAE